MKTYIPYARQSTSKQDVSIPYQLSNIKGHSITQSMNYYGKDFCDVFTGTTTDRPELNKLYKLCRKNVGVIDYVLVQKWDRLGRNLEETPLLIGKFRKIGVEINAVEQWIDFNTGAQNTLLGLYLGQAADESDKNRRRTLDGLYQLKLDGYFVGPHAPNGYKKKIIPGSKRKLLIPNEPNFNIIGDSFGELSLDRYSINYLYNTYGKPLGVSRSAFYALFDNIVYKGNILVPAYKGKPAFEVIGLHDPATPPPTFTLCQQIKENRDRAKKKGKKYVLGSVNKEQFPLKGHLLDFETGLYLTASSPRGGNGKRKTYPTYHLKNNWSVKIKANEAHDIVRSALDEFTLSLEDQQLLRQVIRERMGNNKTTITKQINRLNEAKKKLTQKEANLSEMRLMNEITTEEYRELKERLRIEARGLELKQEAVKETQFVYDEKMEKAVSIISQMAKFYDSVGWRQKDKILNCLFPNGFAIAENKVRTVELNNIVDVIYGKSGDYAYIEVVSEGENTPTSRIGSLSGHRLNRDKVRYHLQLVKNLVG